ncbi:MAG: ABC transporter ATP-binding protein [Anaerolineaceae bacterium]|nr:MAG: ABC transporter ATP-binding protein [Anaerolineaceae bacterium]
MKIRLRFERATIGYGDTPVLNDISLEVIPGEVLGIVGPNGVGKSTLVKGASGILTPISGRIRVDGKEISELSPPNRARLIAVVPQATKLPEAFTARDVVLMGRTPYLGWLDREGESDFRIAVQTMARTNTNGFADRKIGELSGGDQQRLLIARALTQTPSVLLLDEPTAHLDLRHQDEILNLITSLAKEEGLTVLITLHDLNLVARFADRVALLSNGRVQKLGNPEQVLTPEELTSVYGMEIHVTSHPIHGTPLVLS